jgi:SAM-dependent methyltransferase/tetratricopeptide (TPR) repeat protein
MNRKERRALNKQAPASGPRGGSRSSPADELLMQASLHQRQGKLEQAARLYRRALAVEPDNAAVHNNLACMLLDLGELEKASAHFARSLVLSPELFESYPDIMAILVRVNPKVGQAMMRAGQAWPRSVPVAELFDADGIKALVRDSMVRCLLERATIRHLDLESVLTSVREWLLARAETAAAADRIDDDMLAFSCALAGQCFINEYVFACGPDEEARVGALRARVDTAAGADQPIAPLWLVAAAAYGPLGALDNARALLGRDWLPPVRALLAQQIDEPREEVDTAGSLPRLTVIDDEVSVKVRQQYEENPYPRWVDAAIAADPRSLDGFLGGLFPEASFSSLGDRPVDVLVAGCGTGRHSIELAAALGNVRMLAIDLSLASLSYAKRKTRAVGRGEIEYAQADILKLGSIDRTFDVIDAGGVLHHMADPMHGWKVLLQLLRPGGVMHLGFYSKLGRRDVVAARAVIAERGYPSTADGIRACRRDLSVSRARNVANFYDFFSTSECRDLLFHVQEHQIAIPDIKAFVGENQLTFVGFEVPAEVRQAYAARFPADRAMTDLDRWHEFETERPGTFVGMYRFWVRRA